MSILSLSYNTIFTAPVRAATVAAGHNRITNVAIFFHVAKSLHFATVFTPLASHSASVANKKTVSIRVCPDEDCSIV